MSENPIIKVCQLTKTYRVGDIDVHALQDVDLEVERGEFIAIVGASGSGKSTLFNVLGGLTPPTTGSVHINDRDLTGITNAERTRLRKETVGFVFQKYNLLPTLSAEDNIRIVQYIAGRDTEFDASFKEVLNLLGIADFINAVLLGTLYLWPGFASSINTALMQRLPFALIPCFFVPLVAMAHIALLEERRERPSRSKTGEVAP